jgi:hypothetical protein
MKVNNLLRESIHVKLFDREFLVPSNGSFNIPRPFKMGERMSVFINNKPYRMVTINSNEDLYIGNISSKIYDFLYNQIRVNVNPSNGLPFLKIWNKTDKTLSLNGNICIRPQSYELYLGRDHFGVPMGLVLKDLDGLYPEFLLTQPISDLYYGDVSYREPLPLYSEFDNSKVESLIRYFN